MLKFLFLLSSLVGLLVPNIDASLSGEDVIPDPVGASGARHFVRDVTHDVVDGNRNNARIHDATRNVVYDIVPHANAVVHDVVPGSNVGVPPAGNVVYDVVPGPNAALPQANTVVHDVVPGPNIAFPPAANVVHDVVPGPNAAVPPPANIVYDVVPGPNAAVPPPANIVYDVVPGPNVAVPPATNVVHDVVHGPNAAVPPATNVVHDVVHGPNAAVPSAASVVHDVVPGPNAAAQGPGFINALHPNSGIGSSPVAPFARYANPSSLKCGLKPEPYIAYQLSRFSYNYPRYDIINEIQQRPEIQSSVFALRTAGRFRGRYTLPENNRYVHRNKRSVERNNGCVGEFLILRTFFAYNNYCWLLNPVYQDVPFYNCYQGCNQHGGYGTVNRCEATYSNRKVLAYCAGLSYGHRVGYVTIPISTACSCRTYKCS